MRNPAFRVGALAVVVLLSLLAACAREGRVERRLLVVGIDGAEWDVVEPLVERGRMPNLARLMEEGVYCGLRSLEPKQKSPTIWTTIATGKLPEKHGITDYIHEGTGRLMTSNVRTARTFWDILGEKGWTVTVIGWLVTWPAEPVNGWMVTDYFRYPPTADRPLPENLTYPDELLREVESLRVTRDTVPDEDVARLADLDARPRPDEIQRLPLREMLTEMNAINQMDAMVGALRDIVAGDRTFTAVSEYMIERHPTDVCAVYLRGVDTASHKFWAAAHPGEVGFEVARSEVAVFGSTVERYYEFADEMLGRILSAFGDDASVIVCSDHGFEGPKPGKLPGGIRDHGPVGVLVMAGKDIRKGGRIPERSVRDIAPTILALFGLPVAEDMDGSVVRDALTEEFLRSHPVGSVATYETNRETGGGGSR